MSRYAKQTECPVERSKMEIERTLRKYGAERFGYMTEPAAAAIVFTWRNRTVRILLPLPAMNEFRMTPQGRRERSDRDMLKAWEQASRSNWRVLLLVIKAKLEAVETGISTFEHEFLADIVLPDQRTVSEWMLPQLQEVGRMPTRLRIGVETIEGEMEEVR